jgi:hypothetical protein
MEKLGALESKLRYEDALQELREGVYKTAMHRDFGLQKLEVPCVLVNSIKGDYLIASDNDTDSDVYIDIDDRIWEYDDEVFEFDDATYGQWSYDFTKKTLNTMLTFEYGESPKQVKLKNSIEKLLTAKKFLECLNNLEVQEGEPVEGLSSEESEMVMLARGKVNSLDQEEKWEPTITRSRELAIAQSVRRIHMFMQQLKVLEFLLRYENALQELRRKIYIFAGGHPLVYRLQELNVSSILINNMGSNDGKDSLRVLKETRDSMLKFDYYGKSANQVALKKSIKKLLKAREFIKNLDNLEVDGELDKALHGNELKLVELAYEKVKKCYLALDS